MTSYDDAAEMPGEKAIRIELLPVAPGVCVCGELILDKRLYCRATARRALHDLVEDILDKVYPPQPRKTQAEIKMEMAREIAAKLKPEKGEDK